MKKLPHILLGCYLPLLVFSMIEPFTWTNWIAEMTPVLGAVVLLILTWKKSRLSPFAYALAAIWIFMHTIGAKYSFALVPIHFFEFWGRNNFDRVAHFAIGFWAVAIAEWAVMKHWVKNRTIAAVFGVLAIMSVAAGYEIIEWTYAALSGGGVDFLGSQGDVWDAQKDMLADTLGAISSVLIWRAVQKKKE